MQKLYIAKNKYGYYYTKISNKYNKSDKLVTVNIPKDMELPNFGTYTCEYYLDCYPTKAGTTELCIKVTKLYGATNNVVNPEVNPMGNASASASPFDDYNNTTPEVPF